MRPPAGGGVPVRKSGLDWLDAGEADPRRRAERVPSDQVFGTAGPPVELTSAKGDIVVSRHATGGIPLGLAGTDRMGGTRVDMNGVGTGPAGGVPDRTGWGIGDGRPLPGEPASGPQRGGPAGPTDGGSGGSGGSDGGSRGGRRGGGRMRKKQTPLLIAFSAVSEVVVVVTLALVLALVIKTFLVQAFFIPSESMEQTLLTGDRVLVSKLTPRAFDLHRGDIVVFEDPGGWLAPVQPVDQGPLRNGVRDVLTFVGLLPQDSGEHLIKRVIGLPGDHVQCCDAQGRVMVNGVAIDEAYVYPGDHPSDKTFEVTVPAGDLWLMGDHRSVSEDSRWHPTINNGMVPIKKVVGKAFVIVWPLDRASTLGVPDTVFERVPDPPASGS